jgi:O-methyltransferase
MIPQRIRPMVSRVMANTIGRVNLEAPAIGLTSIEYWVRFSRWCKMHPVPQLTNKKAKDRVWLYESVIEKEGLDRIPITYLEFGVFRGDTLRWWVNRIAEPESRFVGFDTFTGLPERWRRSEPEGTFDAQGKVPDISDRRCTFEVGLFQDTLPRYIARSDPSRRFVVQLDADLFTSTLFVLASLARNLKSGDILFFDEFSCPIDEYRAFEEFVRSFRVKYEVLGAVENYTRVGIKILQ